MLRIVATLNLVSAPLIPGQIVEQCLIRMILHFSDTTDLYLINLILHEALSIIKQELDYFCVDIVEGNTLRVTRVSTNISG